MDKLIKVEDSSLALKILESDECRVHVAVYNSTLNEQYRVGEAFLKWNGCCDWSLGDPTMMHYCRASDARELGSLFKAVYALGPLMDNWEG